jgi:hypothetical protein
MALIERPTSSAPPRLCASHSSTSNCMETAKPNACSHCLTRSRGERRERERAAPKRSNVGNHSPNGDSPNLRPRGPSSAPSAAPREPIPVLNRMETAERPHPRTVRRTRFVSRRRKDAKGGRWEEDQRSTWEGFVSFVNFVVVPLRILEPRRPRRDCGGAWATGILSPLPGLVSVLEADPRLTP